MHFCYWFSTKLPKSQNFKKISKFFFKKIFKKKIEIFFSNQNLDLKVSGAQKDCLENIFAKFDRNHYSGTHLIVAQKKSVSKTLKSATWVRSQMRRLYILWMRSHKSTKWVYTSVSEIINAALHANNSLTSAPAP